MASAGEIRVDIRATDRTERAVIYRVAHAHCLLAARTADLVESTPRWRWARRARLQRTVEHHRAVAVAYRREATR